MECLSCKSISGERRISPGPTIHDGRFWLVEHAYPCALKGWLVLVLKRHAEALHEVSMEEFVELGQLQERFAKLLRQELGNEKEYSACFAEAEGFHHIHFHLVAKPYNLSNDLVGTRIFSMLKPSDGKLVPRDEIEKLCYSLKAEVEAGGEEK